VTFSDETLVKKLNTLKNFGIDGEQYTEIAGNAKMNEFQAAMGLCNLKYVNDEIEKRRKVVDRYRGNLSGKSGIKLCSDQTDVTHNYAYFPVVFENISRDEIALRLEKENIFARKYFYPLTCDFTCNKIDCDVPVARYISERVLTLPLYADLGMADVDRICRIILKG